jgi:signal-transduction protein with cAMP-binding, CBS, and nucleotidyltransferase domain
MDIMATGHVDSWLHAPHTRTRLFFSHMKVTPSDIPNLRRILKDTYFLAKLTSQELETLIAALDMRPFRTGDVLIKDGTRGSELLLIGAGAIVITKVHKGEPVELAKRYEGEFIGEIAYVDKSLRTATATAIKDGHVYALSFADMKGILGKNRTVTEELKKRAKERRS